MKKQMIVIIGIFVLIVGVLAWWFSDTQVVKRQTQELADSLTITVTDGKSSRLGKNQDFASLLARSVSCSVDIADYESDFRHDDLVAAHHMLAHNCDSSTVTASHVEITEITESRATVKADLDLSVIETGGTKHGESCNSVLIWKKNDAGKWQLESIEIKSS